MIMKKIEIDPSRLSELEICPYQFFLKYEYNAKYPLEYQEYSNEQELIERCIHDLLAQQGTVKEIVARNLEEMDRIFKPDTIKNVIMILENWFNNRVLQGDLQEINRSFTETFTAGRETVKISGLLHQIEKIGREGTFKVTLFKGENRLYTHDWMIKTYLPIIYALVIKKLYDADKIVISYFMIKYNSEVWVEFKDVDWEYQRQLLENQLKQLMDSRGEKAIVGSHCAYCPRKTVCNHYKGMIMDAFEIKNIHELFSISMEEIIEYISKLDAQRTILKGRSEELKNILIQQLLENGKDTAEYGKYFVGIEQKKSIDCNLEKILKEIKPDLHSKITKIDRKKLEKYLDGLSDEEKVRIMIHCNIKFYKPNLKIREIKGETEKGRLSDILHF